jgi:hypothetical protein
LNSTAAAAWKLCDGNNRPSEIARTLSGQLSAQVDEQVVLLALAQLADAHLLFEPEAPVKLPTRRHTQDWYCGSRRFASGYLHCGPYRCPGSVLLA